MRSYVIASSILFDLITAGQLVRFFMRWPVTVAGVGIPVWVSAVIAIITGTFAIWAFRIIMRTRDTTVTTTL
jgi:hypothetical protein